MGMRDSGSRMPARRNSYLPRSNSLSSNRKTLDAVFKIEKPITIIQHGVVARACNSLDFHTDFMPISVDIHGLFFMVALLSSRKLRGTLMKLKQTAYLCLTFLVLALVGALPSFANTITVTNTDDSGAGSLRDAIATAASGDTINFNVPLPATITLASTFSICNSQTLTSSGPGASQLAISGNNGAVQVFNICSGANVTLSGLTIEKGSAIIGGGLYNNGTLTVTNSTLSGNSADGGGGIYNMGTLTLTNSTLSGNFASREGGGIDNNNGGILAATNTTIAGNSAPNGGGIDNWDTITLKSTLLANNAPAGSCALFDGAIISKGYNLSDDNTCASFFTGSGDQYNVVKGAGLDPKGLQNNGGPTQTIALLPGSPAVDAIPVASCTDTSGHPVTTDQRGVARPQDRVVTSVPSSWSKPCRSPRSALNWQF
jgi:hypothetical protein